MRYTTIVSNFLVILNKVVEGRIATYKLPSANKSINEILFLSVKFNLSNSGIGNAIITRSSVILNAAPANIIPFVSIHLAVGANVHTAETGTHWNAIANTKAIVWHVCHTNMAWATIRKFLVGKIRR